MSAAADEGVGLYVTETALSNRWGVDRNLLAELRRRGIGPPITRRGRTIYYRISTAEEWLAKQNANAAT